MIISRFGDIVSKAIKAILGDDGKLVYRIEPAKVFSPEQNILSTDSLNETQTRQNNYSSDFNLSDSRDNTPKQNSGYSGYNPPQEQINYTPKGFFNPEYTFDNFVRGKNNEFATAAALFHF